MNDKRNYKNKTQLSKLVGIKFKIEGFYNHEGINQIQKKFTYKLLLRFFYFKDFRKDKTSQCNPEHGKQLFHNKYIHIIFL